MNLPHNLEAEEAVIGSLLIDGEAITEVASWLRQEDFYDERNRWCYEGCLALFRRDEPIDQVILAQELFKGGHLEAVGGFPYLAHMVSAVPTSVHLKHYALIVHRLSFSRQLIAIAGEIAAIGYQRGIESEAALRQAEERLHSLRWGGLPKGGGLPGSVPMP